MEWKPEFYVVQFKEIPFEGIANYVCVPRSWLIFGENKELALVAYPNNEDPFDTKDRAENKEKYKPHWRLYQAYIKYKSDTYNDAECWIKTRQDFAPLGSEKIASRETTLKLLPAVSTRQLAAVPEPSENRYTVNKDNPAASYSKIGNILSPEHQLFKYSQTEKIFLQRLEVRKKALHQNESTKQNNQYKQNISMPPVIDNESTEVNNMNEDDHKTNRNSDHPSNTNVQSLEWSTAHHLPSSLKISSQLNNGSKQVQRNIRLSNDANSAFITQNQLSPPNDTSSSTTNCTSVLQEIIKYQLQDNPNVPDMQTNVLGNVPKLAPKENQKRTRDSGTFQIRNTSQNIYKRTNLEEVPNIEAFDGQRQSNPIASEISKHIPYSSEYLSDIEDICQRHLQQEKLSKRSTDSNESNNIDHRTKSQTFGIKISKIARNPSIYTRLQPYQQKPQSTKTSVDETLKPESNSRTPTLHGITKKKPLLDLSYSNNQAILKMLNYYRSLEGQRRAGQNNVGLAAASQNVIASSARNIHSSQMPTSSSQSQITLIHENVHENSRKLLQKVDKYAKMTETNDMTKRIKQFQSLDNVDKSRAAKCVSGLDNNTHQIALDDTMDEPLSSNQKTVSDSEDNTTITAYDIVPSRIIKALDDSTCNVDGTRKSTQNNFTDKPIAGQSSRETKYQTESISALKQQMLNRYSTFFSHIGSMMSFTTQMTDKLRSLIDESTDNYENLRAASNVTPPEICLPFDYDPEDTRWTLKFPKHVPKLGLIELIPYSRVYVIHAKLLNIKEVSKDCESLVQRLLKEVFNRRALSVCLSIKEDPQNQVDRMDNIRPPLDENACKVLLNYVLRRGLGCDWNIDVLAIINSVHEKIKEIRSASENNNVFEA